MQKWLTLPFSVNHDNMESKNDWWTYTTLVSCNMEHVENYVITGPNYMCQLFTMNTQENVRINELNLYYG